MNISRVPAVLAILLLILVTGSLYWRGAQATLPTDLTATGDEAGHFTTGMMFYDYLHTGLGQHPISFAKSYYARYPKVAIGHWPPLFYVTQALWFSISGPSILSARLLCATLAILAGALVWWEARRRFGGFAAWCTSALLLAAPAVAGQAWLVMSDILVGLCFLAAALSLMEALETGSRRAMAVFVLCSLLAVWAKGSGWGIGIYAACLPLMMGRWAAYGRLWYWGCGILILIGGTPFYLVASHFGMGYRSNVDTTLAAVELSRFSRYRPLAEASPWILLVAGAAGLFVLWRARHGDGERDWRFGRALVTLVLAQFLLHFSLGVLVEPRFYVPSVAALALLAAPAFSAISRMPHPWAGAASVALPISLAAAVFASSPPPRQTGLAGFREASRQIPAEGSVALVASDSLGEGALIVELLLAAPSRYGAAIRASKLLAKSDWYDYRYDLIDRTDSELLARLNLLPVHYVLIESRLPIAQMPAHFQMLDRVLREHPSSFPLVAAVPVRRNGVPVGSGVRIYRNVQAAGKPMGRLRLSMGQGRGEVEFTP